MTDTVRIKTEEPKLIGWLCRFQWYRKRIGGFWQHSRVFGWRKVNRRWFLMDLQCFRHEPELYNGGRDLEWYPRNDHFGGYADVPRELVEET